MARKRFSTATLSAIRDGMVLGIHAGTAQHREKYHAPGALKYVRDLSRPKSRNTATEFVAR
ncbi:MAG: hypothetical protein HYU53_06430 [Acidobacteria bacterium]|nr:hypothetical protein [Acidobacteriota bacterium]